MPYARRSEVMMSVSILIPAWNESRTLEATTRALLGIDYDKKQCEIIVVAGGKDGTHEIAQQLSTLMRGFQRYIVIPQRSRGKNFAIQQGIREAKNDIVVLLDADTLVSKQWLKNMVYPLEAGRCDLTIANPEPVKRNWVSDYYMIMKAYLLDRITAYAGGSMAFKVTTVRKGLDFFFDQKVKIGVDYLLARRFQEEGYITLFAEDALVVTPVPSSLKYFVLTEFRWRTAYILIDGFKARSFGPNLCIVGALISAVPLYTWPFYVSMFVNGMYILKRLYIFFSARGRYKTSLGHVVGFVALSYAEHVVSLICHLRHFVGLDRKVDLYQGQRD